jgi:hypothetical protein
MNQSKFILIIIAVLIAVVFLQRTGCTYIPKPAPRIDTVILTISVHDTVQGKPKLIKLKGDTVWKDSVRYKPDTSYAGLLKQYDSVVDKYFTEHIYKTDYKLGTYGTASVLDTVVANMIIGNSIAYNVTIPEKIVTITKAAPAVRQLYVGGGLAGNPVNPINYGHVCILYKDKQVKIFGLSIGYNGQIVYGISSYWKIKF